MLVMTSAMGFGGGGGSLIGNSGNASQSQLSPSSNIRAPGSQGFNQSLSLGGLQLKRGNTPINSQSGFSGGSISSLVVGGTTSSNGLTTQAPSVSRGGMAPGPQSSTTTSVSSIFSNLQSSLSSAFAQPANSLKEDKDNGNENGILHTLDPSEFPSLGGRSRPFGGGIGAVGSGSSAIGTGMPATSMSSSSFGFGSGGLGGVPIGNGGSNNAGLIGSGGVIGSGSSNSSSSTLPSIAGQNHQTSLTPLQSSLGSPSGTIGSGLGGSLGLESLAPGGGAFLNGPAGMMKQPHQESQPEFQIQPDEFPALPGANKQSGESRTEDGSKTSSTPPTTSSSTTTGSNNVADVSGNLGLIPSAGGRHAPAALARSGRGIQTHSDGKVTNIPSGMVMDQFGMVGLLTFIRTAEQDPQLAQLAMGSDLTTLGLNLNSPENLYQNFASPWADTQCRPQDIDYHVPTEYLTNTMIRDKLAPIKLARYGDDLLFFLFYVFPGDVLQIAAAAELFNRDWRYHKEERIWITRASGQEPLVKTSTYERGTYHYFDCQSWRKVAKEFHLDYDKLEDRPALPNSFYNNAHGQ